MAFLAQAGNLSSEQIVNQIVDGLNQFSDFLFYVGVMLAVVATALTGLRIVVTTGDLTSGWLRAVAINQMLPVMVGVIVLVVAGAIVKTVHDRAAQSAAGILPNMPTWLQPIINFFRNTLSPIARAWLTTLLVYEGGNVIARTILHFYDSDSSVAYGAILHIAQYVALYMAFMFAPAIIRALFAT